MHLKVLLLPLLLFVLAAGCKPAEEPVERTAQSDTTFVAPASQVSPAPAATSFQVDAVSIATCAGALGAIASCAEAKSCDDDISTYLPAASRDALIGLETQPGYSSEAFDRYCLAACQTRTAKLDEAGFSKDVCGTSTAVKTEEKPLSEKASSIADAQFLLRGKLKVGLGGIALAELLKTLSPPEKKHETPYDCGSAFYDGSIQEYVYPDFSIETDGEKATVRSVKLIGGNALLLSGTQAVGSLQLARFDHTLGAGAQKYEDAYRVSASADGSLESAFDFHFDAKGQLAQIDYWIGC